MQPARGFAHQLASLATAFVLFSAVNGDQVCAFAEDWLWQSDLPGRLKLQILDGQEGSVMPNARMLANDMFGEARERRDVSERNEDQIIEVAGRHPSHSDLGLFPQKVFDLVLCSAGLIGENETQDRR